MKVCGLQADMVCCVGGGVGGMWWVWGVVERWCER